ncbi:MAG: DUF4293 domain-containing protein [Bacteroidales bacterium]|nr:DUF4293 domain-containing protein [Bacteroidales bacterium]
MVQRIQTLFILAAVVLLGLLFTLPIVSSMDSGVVHTVKLSHAITQGSGGFNITTPIAVLVAIIIAVHLVAVGLFRRRMVQVRLLVFALLLSLGLFGMFWLLWFLVHKATGGDTTFRIAFIFPIIIGILDYLAISNILKDERLVRSVDRIR